MKQTKIILAAFILLIFSSNISYADITDQLTFSVSDFDTSTVLAPDSNYYVRVSCDLTQQASVDSISAPDLVALIYNYSLPQGEQIDSVTITERDSTLLAKVINPVYPKQEPYSTCIDCEIPDFVPPGAWYDSSYYPLESEQAAVARPFSFAFGMSMGSVQIRPVYYDIDDKRLWLITSMSITLHTSSSGQSPRSVTKRSTFAQDRIVKCLEGMVKNPSSVSGNMPSIQTYSYNYPTDPDDIPPEYIIITASRFAYEMGILEYYKNIKGTPVEIVTVEYIAANYSGVDLPEKIRNCIIDKYAEGDEQGASYVILMGNWEDIPMRYAAHINYDTPPENGTLVPTDLYYACLEGSWDDGDHDGIYGEPVDNPDIAADIYVGRVAISDTGHTITWTEKLMTYLEAPGYGDDSYLTTALMATADQGVEMGVHSYIAGHFPNWFTVDIETLEEQPWGGADPCTGPTGGDVIDEISNPTCQFFYSNCHGSPCWYAVCTRGYNEGDRLGVTTDPLRFNEYPDWGYIPDIVNEGREYIHCSISCGVGQLDSEALNPEPFPDGYGPCMAEDELIVEGGAFTGTYNSRAGYWTTSPRLEATRIDWLLGPNSEDYEHRFGPPHYAIKSTLGGSGTNRKVLFGNNLFGDPEFQVYHSSAVRHFSVEKPAGVEINDVDTVTIRVKDSQTQMGIPNVFVTLSKDGEIYERGITNITGRYYPVLHPTSSGCIEIACSKAGYTFYADSIEVIPYCADAVAGDVNGDGYVLGSDVTYAVSYFIMGGPPPPDSCMCPDDFLYHAADANGDCTFIGSDITYLVNFFTGGPAPVFCSDCPVGRLLMSDVKVIPVESTKTKVNVK